MSFASSMTSFRSDRVTAPQFSPHTQIRHRRRSGDRRRPPPLPPAGHTLLRPSSSPSCFLMEASKLLMLSILFALLIAGTRAIHVDLAGSEDSDSALKLEMEQLKSKISSLESARLEEARELKRKDEKISELESGVREKGESVVSLRKKVELLKEKGPVDAEELVGKAHAYSNELEKEVEELKNEIDLQNMKVHALEAQTIEAEKTALELDLKLRSLEKINGEQKQKIQKTERALQVAEEKLVRVRLEATSKLQELKEVHRAWLPPWLSYYIVRCQEIAAANWNEHGKPALGVLVQKVSEKSGQAQKWVEPHLETAKAKWIPVVKARWITFTATARPHMEKASTKAVEIFELCRTTAKPHIVALQEFANPFVQEARTFAKPYVELAATITKPYVDKASTVLKPYTARAVYGYGKLLETTGTYHHQAHDIVLENLEKHDLTKPLATKEFVWFLASASLALPVFLIYKVLSKFFGKKFVKPVRGARSHNHHRRHKRRHADQ